MRVLTNANLKSNNIPLCNESKANRYERIGTDEKIGAVSNYCGYAVCDFCVVNLQKKIILCIVIRVSILMLLDWVHIMLRKKNVAGLFY